MGLEREEDGDGDGDRLAGCRGLGGGLAGGLTELLGLGAIEESADHRVHRGIEGEREESLTREVSFGRRSGRSAVRGCQGFAEVGGELRLEVIVAKVGEGEGQEKVDGGGIVEGGQAVLHEGGSLGWGE